MVCLLLMTAASYFTFTRSWAIAVGMALIVLATFYRGKYWREFLIVIVIGASAFWYWSEAQGSRYTQTAEDDSSAAARPVLWELSLNMAEDNPWFGVGYDQFMKLSPEYAGTIGRDILERQHAGDVIGKYEPHNDFLNVWVSWGFFALLLYIALVCAVAFNFIQVYRTADDPVIRGLGMGGFAALVAYITNSLFHNFFEGSLAFWIIAGFSLVLPKVDQPPVVTEPLFPKLVRSGKEIEWKAETWA
jgi:O-antigen ligase